MSQVECYFSIVFSNYILYYNTINNFIVFSNIFNYVFLKIVILLSVFVILVVYSFNLFSVSYFSTSSKNRNAILANSCKKSFKIFLYFISVNIYFYFKYNFY